MSGLLVAGTTSDAGKSVVTAGLCRNDPAYSHLIPVLP